MGKLKINKIVHALVGCVLLLGLMQWCEVSLRRNQIEELEQRIIVLETASECEPCEKCDCNGHADCFAP
jgi:hypothetical protein